MPCCCCCRFEENLDVLNEKDKLRLTNLRDEIGVERDPHPYALTMNRNKASKLATMSVYLNLYHLISESKNKKLQKIGMGLYHSGVEIGAWEYSFGEPADSRVETGIFVVHPMKAMPSAFYRRMYLGETTITTEQLETLLKRVKIEWPAYRYEVLHRNCNHFTRFFCKRLTTVTPLIVPNWVNRIANWADVAVPRCLARWALTKFDDGPPKSNTLSPKEQERKKQIEILETREKDRARWEALQKEESSKPISSLPPETQASIAVAGPRPGIDESARSESSTIFQPPRPGFCEPERSPAAAALPTGASMVNPLPRPMPNFNAGREPPSKRELSSTMAEISPEVSESDVNIRVDTPYGAPTRQRVFATTATDHRRDGPMSSPVDCRDHFSRAHEEEADLPTTCSFSQGDPEPPSPLEVAQHSGPAPVGSKGPKVLAEKVLVEGEDSTGGEAETPSRYQPGAIVSGSTGKKAPRSGLESRLRGGARAFQAEEDEFSDPGADSEGNSPEFLRRPADLQRRGSVTQNPIEARRTSTSHPNSVSSYREERAWSAEAQEATPQARAPPVPERGVDCTAPGTASATAPGSDLRDQPMSSRVALSVAGEAQSQVDEQRRVDSGKGATEPTACVIPMHSLQESEDVLFPMGDEKVETAFVIVEPDLPVQAATVSSAVELDGKRSLPSLLPSVNDIHQEI